MADRYTKADAVRVLAEFFRVNCPRQYLRGTPEDCLRHNDDLRTVNVSWEASWGVSCSLSFGIDDEPRLNWASTHRTIAQALASIALYKAVLEFAANLESKRQEELSYVRQSDRRHSG